MVPWICVLWGGLEFPQFQPGEVGGFKSQLEAPGQVRSKTSEHQSRGGFPIQPLLSCSDWPYANRALVFANAPADVCHWSGPDRGWRRIIGLLLRCVSFFLGTRCDASNELYWVGLKRIGQREEYGQRRLARGDFNLSYERPVEA